MAPPTEIDDLIPDLMKLKMALERVSARFEHFPEESDERTISAGVMEVQMIIELLFEQTRATIDMKKSAKATFEQLPHFAIPFFSLGISLRGVVVFLVFFLRTWDTFWYLFLGG